MAKATKKSAYPTTDDQPSTSKTKSKKVKKTHHESKARMAGKMDEKPSSRSSGKVQKTTKKGKKTPPWIPKAKASEKISTSAKKAKKVSGKKELFGHYHRLNEELTKSEPDQSSLDSCSIATSDLESQ